MFLIATLLVLTYFPFSLEEPQILQIPLKHSTAKFIDAEVESNYGSKSEHGFPADHNYNLHGMLGQGYYIELAIGQPEQLVNYIHLLLLLFATQKVDKFFGQGTTD